MVRLSDVLGPDGNPKAPPPKEEQATPEIAPPFSLPPSPAISQKILPSPMQTGEVALYQEALNWIRKKFEEAEKGPIPDLAGGQEVIDRIISVLKMGGESLLTLTFSWSEEDYLYPHSVNVSIFSIKVGMGLRLNDGELRQLGLAALVHDLGMAKVPKALTEKAASLSDEEMEIVKKHPIYTVQVLENMKDLDRVILDAISHQHERLDGTSYPRGLREDQVTEFGGIIAIADVYEALTHSPPYRKRHAPDEAMKLIAYSMGSQFKASLIQILKALVRELSIYPIGSYVQLNTKEIGRVVKVNKNFPLLPVLDIYLDGSGNRLSEIKRIDLAQEPLVHIKRPVDVSEITQE